MSQGTPRKFSEKIAIMERKQNEDAEAFASVMNDVRTITNTTGVQQPSTSAHLQSQQQQQIPTLIGNNLIGTNGGNLTIPSWAGRPGGSLPNVHEMVQHQPSSINSGGGMSHQHHHHIDSTTTGIIGWNMTMPWMDQTTTVASNLMDSNVDRVMHPTRGRSPGAHPHFHPYKTGGTTLPYPSKDRVPPLEYHQYPGVIHGNLLQPPDVQWRKARSDPAIHMNVYRQQPLLMMSGNSGDDYAPSSDISSVFSGGPFHGDIPQPSLFYNNADPNEGSKNELKPRDTGISAQDSISSSGGSLPNLPSPLHKMQNNNNNNNSNAAGASFGYPSSSYGSGGGGQTTMVQQHTHVPIQQRHSIQLPPGGTGYPQSHGAYNLAATPPYSAESQSAPTSPADATNTSSPGTYDIQSQLQNIRLANAADARLHQWTNDVQDMQHSHQQWYQPQQQQSSQHYYQQQQQQQPPLQRHYSSTSPDVLVPSPGSSGQIPNIVLTGADGSISGQHHNSSMVDTSLDCFQDLQDLRLDPNDLQALLSNNDHQVDPACENELLNRD